MITKKVLTGAVVALGLLSSSASAQSVGFWPGWGTFSGYVRDYIPYFSRHPPVYYSVPVSYSYGRTPYAALPAVTVDAPQPVIIQNIHVTGAPAAPGSAAPAQPQPQVIRNPFVR